MLPVSSRPGRAEQIASFERVGENELRFMLVDEFPDLIFDEEVAKEWLLSKERERADSAALARDARETNTLRIAIAAIIIAAISSAKEIKWLITSFISWLQ